MKTLLVAILLGLSATAASAQLFGSERGTGSNPNSHYVRPSITSDGAVRSGHWQSNPNSTTRDNWGTSGNINPYTGQVGRRSARD